MINKKLALASPSTYKTKQSPKSTRISASRRSTTKLRLNQQLHNRHRRPINRILLISRCSPARLVKHLRRLGHRQTDQLGLRAPTATATAAAAAGFSGAATTAGEFFEDL